jgi:hypothetical protein
LKKWEQTSQTAKFYLILNNFSTMNTTIAYSLNKTLNGEKILQDIQNLVNGIKDNDKPKVLVISVKEVVSDDTSLIPKITFKP